MKNIILSILCFTFLGSIYSQNKAADAEFLKITKEFVLNTDGSMDYHYTKQLKLLSHFAFNRLYGETFIVYNTDYQKLTINSASTIMADGKVVVTPKNAFNEVLPSFSANAPAYNNLREMVVTHTGLETGCIINLDYTIHTDKGFSSELMGNEILSEESPVDELIVKISVPVGVKLNYQLLNTSSDPDIKTDEELSTFFWNFKSIPANSKENYRVHNQTDVPRLIFSTARDFYTACSEFVSQNAFDLATNESMDQTVLKITNVENDPLKKALALQKIVIYDLNSLNIPLEYTGYKCRSVTDVWNSNSGTHLEKTLLLAALLQKANISTRIYAVVPTGFYNKQIGDLNILNDFVVGISLKGQEELFLSGYHSQDQNLKYTFFHKTALLLDKNAESIKELTFNEFTNKIVLKTDCNILDEDQMTGTTNLYLEGIVNPYFDLTMDSSAIKSMIYGISKRDIKQANLEELTEEISRAILKFEVKNPFQKDVNYFTLNLPEVSNGVDSWHMNVLTAERTSSLEIPETISQKAQYSFILPNDFKLVSNEIKTIVNNGVGSLLIQVFRTGDKVVVKREITFNTKLIQPAQYKDFKEIMDKWNNPIYKMLVIKK